eukprot:7231281-Karenia_brevis.AAC.1
MHPAVPGAVQSACLLPSTMHRCPFTELTTDIWAALVRNMQKAVPCDCANCMSAAHQIFGD